MDNTNTKIVKAINLSHYIYLNDSVYQKRCESTTNGILFNNKSVLFFNKMI